MFLFNTLFAMNAKWGYLSISSENLLKRFWWNYVLKKTQTTPHLQLHLKFHEIWGLHRSQILDCGLLGYEAIYSGSSVYTFHNPENQSISKLLGEFNFSSQWSSILAFILHEAQTYNTFSKKWLLWKEICTEYKL